MVAWLEHYRRFFDESLDRLGDYLSELDAEHGAFDNLITYREVVRPERLVDSHGTSTEPEQFQVTVTFEARGSKTLLTMRSVWPSADLLAATLAAVGELGVKKGGQETLDRLAEHLAG